MKNRVARFVLAVAITYVLAAVAATQIVLASLAKMGAPVSFSERIAATLHDLAGMTSSLLPLIAIGFLIAFLIATLILRGQQRFRVPLFVLAGAVAVIMIHVLLKLSFDITPVAAARSIFGMLVQAVAGALGAYVFAVTLSPSGDR